MKHKNAILILGFIQLLLLSVSEKAIGQCAGIKLNHLSGTQQVGCTEVTVTSDGSVDMLNEWPCYYGPYWIGRWGSGSYTFTFSSPVQGVIIDIQTLDNHSGDLEEMVVDVNGAFFPITVPGTPDGCWDPAVIWPPGTVRAPVNGVGSWRDLYIPGPINEIKVADAWLTGSPKGILANIYICCNTCTTDAGVINAAPLEICSLDPAVFPATEQFNLDPDDMLQYILFSGVGTPLTTILATSNTPSFVLNPATMTAGTSYYIAAIAGNNLNGNVDLDDPCLDISNTIELVWMPAPVVTFFSPVSCLKPGECYDIVINFLGELPIQMTGQVVMGNNVVSTFGGTYTTLTTVQQVCIPLSTQLGPITIEATSISDTFCTCN